MKDKKLLHEIEKHMGADIAKQINTSGKNDLQIISERYGSDMAQKFANIYKEAHRRKVSYTASYAVANSSGKDLKDDFYKNLTEKYSAQINEIVQNASLEILEEHLKTNDYSEDTSVMALDRAAYLISTITDGILHSRIKMIKT